jgi:HEAT repeat protein
MSSRYTCTPRCLWSAHEAPPVCLHHEATTEAAPRGSVAALTMLLRSDTAAVRRYALYQLGQIGPGAKSAMPALVELLVNEQGKIDRHVGWAMDEILGGVPDQDRAPSSTWRRFVDALLDALRVGTW